MTPQHQFTTMLPFDAVKLMDFGTSYEFAKIGTQRPFYHRPRINHVQTFAEGTEDYMAPEMAANSLLPDWRADERKDIDGYKADIWSLGVVLIELATGRFPFPDAGSHIKLACHIVDGDPPTLPAAAQRTRRSGGRPL